MDQEKISLPLATLFSSGALLLLRLVLAVSRSPVLDDGDGFRWKDDDEGGPH